MKVKIVVLLKLIYLLPLFTCFLYGQNTENHKIFGIPINASSIDPTTGIIRCASTEYEEYLQGEDKSRISEKQFEEWLAPKTDMIKKRLKLAKTTNELIIIPIVVHVIHNGTKIGVGSNISDERVQSQITVLNQDYRKMLGTPGHNDNPVGADIGIEFRFARVDPDGNPTTGINRVSKSGYVWNTNNIENILKPQTQWDPEKYLNIWVCEFGGNLIKTLGYAQFPLNSGLSGMQGPYTAQTDGVVISWGAFGSSDLAPGNYIVPYDKGRTLTHEIGHTLGLRHIWGDNSTCVVNATDSYNDYCLDTPAASMANLYCDPDNIADSCPSDLGNDMVENYMDYTHDTCMNIFTQDQKARMITVLQNSPRRASLTTSNVWMSDKEVGEVSSTISVYPNPVDDKLNVELHDPEEFPQGYEIYDSVGKILRRADVNAKPRFSVVTNSLSPGVYVMKLSTSKRTKKIRFLVKR